MYEAFNTGTLDKFTASVSSLDLSDRLSKGDRPTNVNAIELMAAVHKRFKSLSIYGNNDINFQEKLLQTTAQDIVGACMYAFHQNSNANQSTVAIAQKWFLDTAHLVDKEIEAENRIKQEGGILMGDDEELPGDIKQV